MSTEMSRAFQLVVQFHIFHNPMHTCRCVLVYCPCSLHTYPVLVAPLTDEPSVAAEAALASCTNFCHETAMQTTVLLWELCASVRHVLCDKTKQPTFCYNVKGNVSSHR